uniref:Uncharacterized protein n=1 Tax=Romanomermis culicivorax TaxID=13658 RepID=A0A915KL75_ROMCU
MVQDAKHVALNPRDQNAAGGWRNSNRNLLDAVGGVRNAITSDLLNRG